MPFVDAADVAIDLEATFEEGGPPCGAELAEDILHGALGKLNPR